MKYEMAGVRLKMTIIKPSGMFCAVSIIKCVKNNKKTLLKNKNKKS